MALQKSLDEQLDQPLKHSFPAFDMPTTFGMADEDEEEEEDDEDDEDEDEDEDDEDEDEEEGDEE